jgi:hypothetical protein
MGIVTAWLTEMGLITYRNSKKAAPDNVAGFPLPADYLASFAIFGVLAALPDSASKLSGAIGWGYVVATFLNLFNPTNPTGKTTTATTATSSTKASTVSTGVAPASTPSATLV